MNNNYIEYIGYAASFFVAISFTFKKIKQLRIINIIGCVFFIVYGYFIDSVPVMVTNFFIVLMNTYYLVKKDKLFPVKK